MPYEGKENHVELKVGLMTYPLRTPMTDACAKEVENLANQFITVVSTSNKRLSKAPNNFQDTLSLALLNASYAFYQSEMQRFGLADQVSDHTNHLSQWQQQVRQAEEEVHHVKLEVSERDKEIYRLQTELKNAHADRELLEKEVQDYKQKVNDLYSKQDQLEKEKSDVMQENIDLQKKLEEAANNLQEQNQQMNNQQVNNLQKQNRMKERVFQSKTDVPMPIIPPLHSDMADYSIVARPNSKTSGLTSLISDYDKINKDQVPHKDPVEGSIPLNLRRRHMITPFMPGDESESEEANSLYIAPDDNQASGAEII